MGRFEGGGLSGEIFLWTSARVPNSAPRPHPHRAALTFPGLCLPRSLRWDLPRPRRSRSHPLPTTNTHTDTPPYLSSRPWATGETTQYLGK